jgi:hypothetical protein
MTSPARFVLETILILLVMVLAIGGSAMLVHGGSPFQAYSPGVPVGAQMIYNCWGCLGIGHSYVTITVTQIIGTAINYTETYTDDYGEMFLNITYVQDVSAPTSIFPQEFIGAGLHGGPTFPGSSMVMKPSIFGHIIDGQWRATNYWDANFQAGSSTPGLTLHMEWDTATGILTFYQDTYNGAGMLMTLKSTNLWGRSFFWTTVASTLSVAEFVAPFILIAFVCYLVTFLVIGIIDWSRVRKMRNNRNGKGGGSGFPYKFYIIAALIMGSIMIALIIIVSLVLGSLGI